MPVRIVMLNGRETNLLQMVATATPAGRSASGLDCRQQEPDQRADDGNDHEQFHERETNSS